VDKKTMLALADANAIKKVFITASGSQLYIRVTTPTGEHNIETNSGQLKTWATLDACAKWLHKLGIGKIQVDIARWHPNQKGMSFSFS
jgi:hypothetical protein